MFCRIFCISFLSNANVHHPHKISLKNGLHALSCTILSKSIFEKRLLYCPDLCHRTLFAWLCPAIRAWVVGWVLEECLSYRVTHCPTAFAPRLACSEGVLLAGAVSRVTKAPFYTTGVQRMGHSTVVLLGSAPARCRWISDLPLCSQQTPSLVGMFFRPSLAEISEGPGAPATASKPPLKRINDHTTYA